MLQFEESFFMPELREGFYISERMKRCWAASLEDLAIVDQICRMLQIQYFVDSGTLLGAVRHQGFIPWDDDIDIAMLREDYMRFLKEAPPLMPDGMHISSIYTVVEGSIQFHGIVRSRNDIGEDRRLTEKYYGCPFITGLDIYPLDYLPSTKEGQEDFLTLYTIYYDGGQRFVEIKENGELEGNLDRIESLLGETFDRTGDLRLQFYQKADKVAMKAASKERAAAVAWMPEIASKGWTAMRDLRWYEDRVKLPFEGLMLDAPIGYDQLLSNYYSPDYMTHYEKFTNLHEYPYYKIQIDYLKKEYPELAKRILSYAPDGDWGESTLLFSEKERIKSILSIWMDEASELTENFPLAMGGFNEDDICRMMVCQQEAIEIGILLENRIAVHRPIVSLLEVYCEALYQCGEGECEPGELLRILKDFGEAMDELPVCDG